MKWVLLSNAIDSSGHVHRVETHQVSGVGCLVRETVTLNAMVVSTAMTWVPGTIVTEGKNDAFELRAAPAAGFGKGGRK